jgi:hypothetical protein
MRSPHRRRAFLIDLLRRSMADYTERRADLGRLVSDVKSLIDSLEQVADPQWAEQLRSAWWKLELVYALALSEGRSELTDADRNEVQRGIEGLSALLAAHPLGRRRADLDSTPRRGDPVAGRDPRRRKLRSLLERDGLVSLLKDTKWMRLVDALRPLPLRYRVKLVTSDDVSGWDDRLLSPAPNYLELPSVGPVLALEIEWLEIAPRRRLDPGNLDAPADHATITALLQSLRVPFSTDGVVVRVVGHQRPAATGS